jgi:hypothetical protein
MKRMGVWGAEVAEIGTAVFFCVVCILKILRGHSELGAMSTWVFYGTGIVEGCIAGMVISRRLRAAGMIGALVFGLVVVFLAIVMHERDCGCLGRGIRMGWKWQAISGCLVASASSYWITRKWHSANAMRKSDVIVT